MIRAEHLCKSFDGHSVIRDLSFTLRPGLTFLTAPSGAGKTTLLRLLAGLETPDSGKITGTENSRLSVVFQEDRLLPALDAENNLRFVLGERFDAARAAGLMTRLGLDPQDKKTAAEYSGGMKRRLALCRALLADSDVMLLDEPFAGLDAENRTKALACIREYGAGKPVLLATHDADGKKAGDALISLG